MNIKFADILKAIGQEGQPIVRVRLFLANGSKFDVEIPQEVAEESEDFDLVVDEDLERPVAPKAHARVSQGFRDKVLGILGQQDGPITRKALSNKCGWKSGCTGRNAQQLDALIAAGDVLERDNLLYDAPYKFPYKQNSPGNDAQKSP